MKTSWALIVVGLVAVAAVAFMAGRSGKKPLVPPSPDTGGPVPGMPTSRTARGESVGTATMSSRPTTRAGPTVSERTRTFHISRDTYSNPELGVTLAKPKGAEWTMTDNSQNFRAPEPHKVLEMCRRGRGADQRFAAANLYVVDMPAGSSELSLIQDVERIDKKAKPETFRVLDERSVDAQGQQLMRRVTLRDTRGQETKFLSVRWTSAGKLYVLLAFTEPRHFDELLPEFEETVASLRLK
jgi:hypothetical protein